MLSTHPAPFVTHPYLKAIHSPSVFAVTLRVQSLVMQVLEYATHFEALSASKASVQVVAEYDAQAKFPSIQLVPFDLQLDL